MRGSRNICNICIVLGEFPDERDSLPQSDDRAPGENCGGRYVKLALGADFRCIPAPITKKRDHSNNRIHKNLVYVSRQSYRAVLV